MEFLGVIASLAILGMLVLGLLKLAFWVLVIPFKIGFFLLKGLIGLVFFIPLVVLWACGISVVVPVLIGILALPALAVVFAVVALAKLIS